MTASLVVLLAALAQAHPQVPSVRDPLGVTIRLSAHYPDGRVLSRWAGRGFPIVDEAYMGETLCVFSTTNRRGYGWDLRAELVEGTASEATLRVTWQRKLEAGKPARDSEPRTLTVTLAPNETVLLDYMPAGPVPEGRTCDATGLTLSVTTGLRRVEPSQTVEAQLWLVHRAPDGTEQSQPLVVRAQPYQDVPFAFGGMRVATPAGDVQILVRGSLVARPEGLSALSISLGVGLYRTAPDRPREWRRGGSGTARFVVA